MGEEQADHSSLVSLGKRGGGGLPTTSAGCTRSRSCIRCQGVREAMQRRGEDTLARRVSIDYVDARFDTDHVEFCSSYRASRTNQDATNRRSKDCRATRSPDVRLRPARYMPVRMLSCSDGSSCDCESISIGCPPTAVS